MTEKRFLLESSDYDLKYEFRIADLSKVEKTKEDFWNEKMGCYMYIEFLTYLYKHGAFLTQEDADIVLNKLSDENDQLKLENGEMEDYIGRLEEVNEELKQKISELKEDNDHKFWKLQFMHQFNTTQLIVHEIGRAIDHGYEVSDKFQEYLNELKERNEKGKEKAIEQEKW